MPEPIYTAENCHPAYQLRWSLALFADGLPGPEKWLQRLKEAVEPDKVRILEQRHKPPNVWFFLLSTKPPVSPAKIVKSVKGRLQHLVRADVPSAFRRNFSLTAVGDARRDVVEKYVEGQLGHHRMADQRVEQQLARFQLAFPEVDLSQPVFSSHGRYHCNLHAVLVHQERWREVRLERLEATRDMVLGVARKRRHRLSRLALLSDHVHVTLGFGYEESPEEVALAYLNNLAYAHGMKGIFTHGYYVGTFGKYDMGAIR
jgi:REP element-mobilizing transposase RayT